MLYPHQIEASKSLIKICKTKGCAYLFGPPRVGKTLTALEAATQLNNLFSKPKKIIVFTRKNAIEGWTKYNNIYAFEIANYEKIVKLKKDDYSLVIIDEAHNFSAFPKPSQRIKDFKAFCINKPILFLSGTPFVEGYLKAYSQFSISSYSPFKDFKTPYSFFNTYGISYKKYLAGRMIETYSKCKTIEIEKLLKPYIVKLTYKDAGFTYQNYDEIFLINSKYKELEKRIRIQCVLDKNILETASSVNQCLHQLCGGWFRGTLYSQEKLLWLKKYISKSKGKTAIMAYFIEEQEELSKIFKDCTILSSTKYCEGIDLSHYDNFILYSFGYSGSKFIQLRDRIVNLTKDKPTKVIIPLLKDGIDKNIYEVVSKKKNFNLKSFSKEENA